MSHNPIHTEHSGSIAVPTEDPHDEHGHDKHGEQKSWFQLPSFLQYENLPKPIQGLIDHNEYVCEEIFHVRKRGSSVSKEIALGFVQFISCLYVLPVVPEQLELAGYHRTPTIVSMCLTCALGCIIGSVTTNMPFIIAPPTGVSIFLSVYIQQQHMTRHDGNVATIISGVGLLLCGIYRPLGTFITRLIPDCIQASTSVGIGLITALAGCTEVHLVVRGKYTVLDMGEITPEILISFAAVIIVSVALHYHIKGAFCLGLFFGTIVWWMYIRLVPELYHDPHADKDFVTHESFTPEVVLLIFNLFFLNILTLNGLARANSDLAHLTHPNGAIPRGRWLFIVCGISSVVSGCFSGPPILISPESAAGIKAGAKTGLSTLICGLFFGVSAFFSPIFAEVPPAGTAPLLLMVGVLLFQNAKRIDWSNIGKAVPSFCCLFFIPFTYSILRGVAFGYVTYIIIGMFTGDFWIESTQFLTDYLVPKKLAPKDEDDLGKDPPSDNVGGGGFFSGIVNKLKNMDMTHSDDNVVPISQEYTSDRPVGGSEDREYAEQVLAREEAKEKMKTAQESWSRLMKEAELPKLNIDIMQPSSGQVRRASVTSPMQDRATTSKDDV